MKRFRKLLMIVIVSVGLVGCRPTKTQVAYTVYPIKFLIEHLSSDTVKAVSIQNDEIVHRATIKENYKDILKHSEVLMNIGPLEPYISMYANDINHEVSSQLDLSSMNAVYEFKRYTPVMTDDGITFYEGPYYKGDVFDSIDTDKRDLNLWMDPIAMLSMAKNIRDWLIEKFPDNESIYHEEFKKLETDLINLDAQYQALATANENNQQVIRFVSMTASFGNWQKTYGFQVYPVILSKYGVLPTPEQLQIIKDRIKADGVKYIVYEPNMTPDMIALFGELEEELKLVRVEMSNLSSMTESDNNAGKDYLSIMYENLGTLKTMVEDRKVDTSEIVESAKENDQTAPIITPDEKQLNELGKQKQ